MPQLPLFLFFFPLLLCCYQCQSVVNIAALPQRPEEDSFRPKAEAEAGSSPAHAAAGRRAEPLGRPGAAWLVSLLPRPEGHEGTAAKAFAADVGEPWDAGPGVLTAGEWGHCCVLEAGPLNV